MVIYSTRYDRGRTGTMLSLCCHELMGNIQEHGGKKYLMVNDYVLDKVLDRIKNNRHWRTFRFWRFFIEDFDRYAWCIKNDILL